MGRVSKYKKVKAFDPFSKQRRGQGANDETIWGFGDTGRRTKKRSLTALRHQKRKEKSRGKKENDGFDLPPVEKDDFDLNDILGVKKDKRRRLDEGLIDPSAKAVETGVNGTVLRATIPETEEEEKRVARILKSDQHSTASVDQKKKMEVEGKKEGESMRAFSKRMKQEAVHVLQKKKQTNNAIPERRQRKKEFLKNKKLKKKGSQNVSVDYNEREDDEDDDGGFVTGERAAALLGDQVERPPVFSQLPRGAKPKLKPKPTTEKELKIEAETRAMEAMRRRVQAQYAVVKAKRRTQGDFHL